MWINGYLCKSKLTLPNSQDSSNIIINNIQPFTMRLIIFRLFINEDQPMWEWVQYYKLLKNTRSGLLKYKNFWDKILFRDRKKLSYIKKPSHCKWNFIKIDLAVLHNWVTSLQTFTFVISWGWGLMYEH